MSAIQKMMQELEPEYIKIRRYLHQHPELSFQEENTTKFIKDELNKYGIEVYDNKGFTGAVGILHGAMPGKTIALRADIDALPVKENTGLEFASVNEGCCHACGHDLHMTSLLAAARLLSKYRQHLHGTVKFFFQPAEEKLGGSETIINNGFLDDVDAVFGVHTWPDVPGGSIGIKYGPMMAGSDSFKITITAPGGHAAHPHKTPDPIAAAAYMITQLQTIVSRELNPLDSAVITVGKMTAGTAANIIPSEVVLEGSMRYLLPETRRQIHESIKRIADGTALALRVHAETEIIPGCGGNDKVSILPSASMGSEDFSFYLAKKPGAFFRIGTGMADPNSHLALHNGKLLFSEDAISAGAVTFCGIVFLFTGSDFSILE